MPGPLRRAGHAAGARPARVPRTQPPPLLRLRGIGKHFGPVQALSGIDLDIPAGQVTALVG